jgi:hypothetical protein
VRLLHQQTLFPFSSKSQAPGRMPKKPAPA